MNIVLETAEQINNTIARGKNNFTGGNFAGTSECIEAVGFISHIRHILPSAYVRNEHERFLLVTDLPEDLEKWLETGEPEKYTYHVLSESREKELTSKFQKEGYKVTRGEQKMHYMRHVVHIEYLRVSDPAAKTSVAIIPWFMVFRKKYPVFMYIYVYWCSTYRNKSERYAANAARVLFGEKMHYSTVSRSPETVQAFVPSEEPDMEALPADGPKDFIFDYVQKMLAAGISNDNQETAGEAKSLMAALEKIPPEYADIISAETKRPTTPPSPGTHSRRKKEEGDPNSNKNEKPMPTQSVSDSKLGDIRRDMISRCRDIALDNATQCYKFFFGSPYTCNASPCNTGSGAGPPGCG
jgi:hypothetical protein